MEQTGYWRAAVKELKSLKRLVFAALMCALSIVIGALYVVVGDNLRVYFTFFVTAVGCAVYGPVMGMLAAAVTDTLNFFLFPSGPYFPGYMLSEMAAALIYGLFLYRKKITVLRLFGAKFLVNYLVNVGLGCLWSSDALWEGVPLLFGEELGEELPAAAAGGYGAGGAVCGAGAGILPVWTADGP